MTKPANHNLLSVIFLALLLIAAYYLDRLVSFAATRTEFHVDTSWLLMGTSWAWAKIISRLTISILIFGCAAFVLYPRKPSRAVATIYLLAGIYLTFLPLPWVAATMGAPIEWYTFQIRAIAIPSTAPFLMVIGVAAWFRRHIPRAGAEQDAPPNSLEVGN